jgi:hypothetical protein
MKRHLERIRRRPLVLAGIGVAALAVAATAAAIVVQSSGVTPPPEKQAVLDRSLGPPANPGPAAAKGRGTHEPPPTPVEPPAHAGEIGTPESLGGVPVPFSSATFDVTNMWMNLRGQIDIHIYAGDLPSDPKRGALVVTLTNAVTGDDLPGSGQFETPKVVGPIQLTGVRGNTVTYSYSGGTGTFDLMTHRFSM